MGTDSESSSKPRSATKLIDGGSSSSSDDERPASGYHYFALFILCIINLLNFMDRYTVAAVLTDIQDYYSINDSEAGLLQTVFIVFYTIFAPICGYLGDRYNRKWIMTIGICVWSGAVLSSTFIPKEYFVVFLVLRGIVGIGEASYSTCSPTLIADMFTGKRRSRALMLFYFAIPVG
uniref:Major facilitator superfamily (MFS) profile domain-containing protein n=1 Tax=Plectus sambesii TaxID=2011161 RepID=A0A914XNG7_9BILA